jgi:hypothetical protein
MLLAFERTKLIARKSAPVDLTAMIRAAGADTADKVVDHVVRRFLSVPLGERERLLLVDFLRGKLGSASIRPSEQLEDALRELLYLVLSAPEYQLG